MKQEIKFITFYKFCITEITKIALGYTDTPSYGVGYLGNDSNYLNNDSTNGTKSCFYKCTRTKDYLVTTGVTYGYTSNKTLSIYNKNTYEFIKKIDVPNNDCVFVTKGSSSNNIILIRSRENQQWWTYDIDTDTLTEIQMNTMCERAFYQLWSFDDIHENIYGINDSTREIYKINLTTGIEESTSVIAHGNFNYTSVCSLIPICFDNRTFLALIKANSSATSCDLVEWKGDISCLITRPKYLKIVNTTNISDAYLYDLFMKNNKLTCLMGQDGIMEAPLTPMYSTEILLDTPIIKGENDALKVTYEMNIEF